MNVLDDEKLLRKLKTMYNNQLHKSKLRGHDRPTYNFMEMLNWCVRQDNFEELCINYIKSNYNKKLKPSIDRLDDYIGYRFNNIRLVTWEENDKKGHSDMIEGKNRKTSRAVVQYTIEGDFLVEYYSAKNAERVTGVDRRSIGRCCSEQQNTAGGFKWRYKLC